MNLLAVLLDSLEGETKQREILKVRGGCQRKPEDERISGGGCKHLHGQPAEKRALRFESIDREVGLCREESRDARPS